MNRMNRSDTMCILKFKESFCLFVVILTISATLATADSLNSEIDDAISFLDSEEENENVPIGWNVLIDTIVNDNRISDLPLIFNDEEEEKKNSNEDIYRYYARYKPDAIIHIDDNIVQSSREPIKQDPDIDHPTVNSKDANSIPAIGGRNIISLPLVCPPGQRPDRNKRCRLIL